MPANLAPYDQELQLDDPGLLGRLGRVGLSGVSAISNLLDTPASMARDVLAFENPLDNLLNPFSSDNRTSGRDLNRKWGLSGSKDSTANWWGGLATEILTDPLLYVGIGALAKGAQVGTQAAATGTRGLLRASIPGTKLGVELGTGARAEKIAELGLGYLSKAKGIAAASPIGRGARQLFDVRAGGVSDEIGQGLSSSIYDAKKAADIELRRKMSGVAHEINGLRSEYDNIYGDAIRGGAQQQLKQMSVVPSELDMAGPSITPFDAADEVAERIDQPTFGDMPKGAPKARGKVADDMVNSFFNRMLRHVAETGSLDDALKQLSLPAEKMTPELASKITGTVASMRKAAGASWDELLDMGVDAGKMDEILEGATPSGEAIEGMQHFPRYAGGMGGMLENVRRLFTKPASAMGRVEEIKHLPADVVNKILTDPKARGKDAAAYIEQKWGKWLGREMSKEVDEAGNAVPKWASPTQHAEAVAEWAKKHSKFPVFTNSMLDDFYKYQHQASTAKLTVQSIHNLLSDTIGEAVTALDNGVPVPQGATGYIPVSKVFTEGAKMNADKAGEYLAKIMSDKFGKTVSAADVLKMQVPEEVANAIAAVKRVHDEPEWFRSIGGAVDELTNLFKSNVTIPFPSFWARNHIGGQFINLTTGLVNSPQDLKEYVTAYKDSWKLLKDLDGDALSEMFVEGVINPNMLSEGVEASGHVVPQFTDFRHPFNLKQTFGEVSQQVADAPTPLPGMAGQAADAARKAGGTWMKTGEKVSGAVEYMNRATMYTYLKRKGWSPRQAAEKVLELQIDYGKHTPFEKNVMKRLIPFYSFHRGIAPVILGTLARNPTGPLGQTIRASRLASSDDPRMPEWMGDTLAMENPLGSSEPGGQSYITGLGLPHEATLGYFGGGLRGFGREALSQLNPLIKAPLEWSTGTSFFQSGPGGGGRPLDEMNPPIGQTLANVARIVGRDPSTPVPTPALAEFAVANSPLSRYVTTARQITDPRKHPLSTAANLLTGVRVTDVSPQAQDSILRGRANELIRQMGGRTLKRSYFPDADKMPQADQEVAQGLKELLAELDRRGRQRREAGM